MEYTQATFPDPGNDPELTLKTDGDVYYAVPNNTTAANTYPAAEFPCYLITTVRDLLAKLTEQTDSPPGGNTQSTIDSVETTTPRENCHYALVHRGHLYLLEEREYNPQTTSTEYTRVSAVGYINKTIRLIEATLTATRNELDTIDTPGKLIDRIANPDSIDPTDVRKIATNPDRPTLADYRINH